MGELEAVSELKKGNKAAFSFFFKKYYNLLVAYVATYTHNKTNAEDIVQQAFINLWNNRAKLDETKSPKNYLYSIAYNKYIDTVKSNKKQQQFLNEVWKKSLESIVEEDQEVVEKRIEKMKQILAGLPPKCKEIIELNKLEGVKYKDIAKRLGISIKTVESQMRIAFKKIREGFDDNEK